MADITNGSGEVIVASPSELPVPAEYAGLTIEEIYNAMCVEAGLDPAVTDGNITPSDSVPSSFIAPFNPFYSMNSLSICESYKRCFINFYVSPTGSPQITELVNVNLNYLGVNEYINFNLINSQAIPVFSIGLGDNINTSYATLITGTKSTSNSSVMLFHLKHWTTFSQELKAEMTLRVKLSGEIDFFVKAYDPDVTGGIFGFNQTQGETVVSPPFSNQSTIWTFPDQTVRYFNSPEVERAFIKGIVQKGAGNYLARDITVLDSETKGVRNTTTSSAADGSFSISVTPDTEYMVICEDQGADPANALIFDRVVGKPDA